MIPMGVNSNEYRQSVTSGRKVNKKKYIIVPLLSQVSPVIV